MYTIYSKENCSFCEKAIKLLQKHNFEYELIKIGTDISREEVLNKFPDRNTVPIILFNHLMIGGYNDLLDHFQYMYKEGMIKK